MSLAGCSGFKIMGLRKDHTYLFQSSTPLDVGNSIHQLSMAEVDLGLLTVCLTKNNFHYIV